MTTTREAILSTVKDAFLSWPRPARVSSGDMTRWDYQQIEADFGGKEREALTYPECSMMLVDGAMLTAEAYFYFLPRLAEAVLVEGGDWVLLGLRLDALGTGLLNQEQTKAVLALRAELERVENEMKDV